MSTDTKQAAAAEIPMLVSAARVLFGAGLQVTTVFFLTLKLDKLKTAFREQALRNHPDKAAELGVDASVLQKRFTAIRKAYEILLPFVSGQKQFPFRAPTVPTVRPVATPRPAARATAARPAPSVFTATGRKTYYRGRIPDRPLRFAEFLYYSKLICWEEMLAALTWQKRVRPRLRDIALEKGILTAGDMVRLARSRLAGETLRDTALRLRLLDAQKLRLLAGYQRLQGCPIGRYFVDNRILMPSQLETMLKLNRRHNILLMTCLATAKVG